MALQDGQVMIYNQKKMIPPTSDLWVVVGFLSVKPFGIQRKFNNGISYQAVNMYGLVSIEIQSHGPQAMERKEEIMIALSSHYAQALQERYGFHIGRIPTAPVANLSEQEGAAIPYRYNYTYGVQYKVEKQKEIEYYNTFEDAVTVEE